MLSREIWILCRFCGLWFLVVSELSAKVILPAAPSSLYNFHTTGIQPTKSAATPPPRPFISLRKSVTRAQHGTLSVFTPLVWVGFVPSHSVPLHGDIWFFFSMVCLHTAVQIKPAVCRSIKAHALVVPVVLSVSGFAPPGVFRTVMCAAYGKIKSPGPTAP